ncbi:serine protease hepsin-like [Armigeres subalbatus]|uniref:serine protease hepsin-like n=1 Tax=Armigeres subalbatus TaxID=124917 RepID=UPI002ED24C0C
MRFTFDTGGYQFSPVRTPIKLYIGQKLLGWEKMSTDCQHKSGRKWLLVIAVLSVLVTSKVYALEFSLDHKSDESSAITTLVSIEATTMDEATQTDSTDLYEGTTDVTESWTTDTTEDGLEQEATFRKLNCTECKCGNRDSLGKIVGGSTSKENAYPWMVALYYRDRFTCGGSLITDRYILTAAHCVFRLSPARFRVQLLVHNRTQPTTNSVERSVKAIKTFFYSGLSNNNDIALMELTFPVTIAEDHLVPICLPQTNDALYDGKMAVVTGWGKTAYGGLSATLQELEVPILTNSRCRRAGYWLFEITNRMLCAGYIEGGRDSCQGDSGGPLQVYNNETHRYELVGIVSWGRACAQKNYPGVYTRVNKFLRWINNNVKDSCICT